MQKIIIALFSFLFALYSTNASENFSFDRILTKASILQNFYNANFNSFEGALDCGNYRSGTGQNFGLSIAPEFSIFNYSIGFTTSIFNRSGIFKVESHFPSFDSQSQQIVQLQTENSIDAKLVYLEFEPYFIHRLSNDFISGPINALFGLKFATPLASSFEQKERIIAPENATFLYQNMRLKEISLADGNFSTLNKLLFGLKFGIENQLSIGKGNFFTQSLVFNYYFSDVLSDANWKLSSINLALGVSFSLIKDSKIEVFELLEPDAAPPREDLIIESLSPELNVEILSLVQVIVQQGQELLASKPLVNAVFFEQGSAELTDFYFLQAKNLPTAFEEDAVLINRYLIPILAEMAKNNEQMRILIEGAGSSQEAEVFGSDLAFQRANAVKNALIKLGIPELIIETKALTLPRNPSNQDFPEGIAENQRVDIVLKNAPLVKYVANNKYSELQGTIKTISTLKLTDNNAMASLKFNFSDTTIFVSSEQIVELPFNIRLEPNRRSIEFRAEISANDLHRTDSRFLKLDEVETISKELSLNRFEAILRFDYNSCILSDENKNLMTQLANLLPEGSKIFIAGSTDALGSEQSNIRLSQERAKATADYIKSVSTKKFDIATEISQTKYPEDTPVGRFLNRAIIIRIE